MFTMKAAQLYKYGRQSYILWMPYLSRLWYSRDHVNLFASIAAALFTCSLNAWRSIVIFLSVSQEIEWKNGPQKTVACNPVLFVLPNEHMHITFTNVKGGRWGFATSQVTSHVAYVLPRYTISWERLRFDHPFSAAPIKLNEHLSQGTILTSINKLLDRSESRTRYPAGHAELVRGVCCSRV